MFPNKISHRNPHSSRYRTQVVFLSFLFAVFFALAAPLQAQPEACSSCGPGDMTPWTSGGGYTAIACQFDCLYEVNFRWRTCQNGTYEVIIDGFTPLTPNACQGVNIESLLGQSGIGAVLQHSVGLFGIANPWMPFHVCVMVPTCMMQDPNTSVIGPCTQSCCTVCYELVSNGGVIETVSISAMSTQGSQTCTPPCVNICPGLLEMYTSEPVYEPCDLGCTPCTIEELTPYTTEVVQGCYEDCELEVTFEWRECGDPVKRDMRLTGICITNAPCNTTNEGKLIEAAMGLVLQEAHTLYNFPNPYTLSYYVYFAMPTCMALDPTDNCFKACTDACCSNLFGIQLDPQGEVMITSSNGVNSTHGDQNCTGFINGAPCENRCDVMINVNFEESLIHECPEPPSQCLEDCYWTLLGNGNTDPSVNFLGTTDAKDLVLRTDNVEHMRILSTGQVGINNASPSLNAQLTLGTGSNNRLQFGMTEWIEDGQWELIVSTGTGTTGYFRPEIDCHTDLGNANFRWENFYLCGSIYTTSDLRDKTEIESLQYGLDHVMALNPVSYKLMDGENTPRLGLVAQEVQTIIPEVVYDPADDVRFNEDGSEDTEWRETAHMGIAYQDLIPVLVKAMQEQQAEIQALKAAIADDPNVTSVNNRVAAYANILLEQNQPNPFADETTIAFYVPQELSGNVELLVKDLSGQEVLPRMSLQTGNPASITLDATQLPAGVYIYGIAIDGQLVVNKKLMLIR